MHCQNPGRTEVIQHLGAIRHQFRVDELPLNLFSNSNFRSVNYISNGRTQHQKPWPSAMQFVVRNPTATFRSPSSDRTFNAKSLMGYRTLQHICKAHKTHRTKANLAKELQLPTHGKQSAVRQNNATFL